VKNIPETDAIFDPVHHANRTADQDPKSLRISIDSKAKVQIGHRSRGGKGRGLTPKKADDHDTDLQAVCVPFGMLDVLGNPLTIFFGPSNETSDCIVDCLESWWYENAPLDPDVEDMAINVDKGPSVQSHRPQCIRRMVEFSHQTH
jgi:hypothetical protein